MPVALRDVPESGQLVNVRARRWVVNEVRRSTLPPPPLGPATAGPHHLVLLSSVEDDGLGEELRVVWEIEPGARVVEKVALPVPVGFDPPGTHDAFLDAVRWGAASSADLKNIQAPFRSGIEIQDYQLDPVVRAIQMPRVNLLIADDVGLGKTIEAGMVALELIIRHRARKVLIVCPSALQIQWKEQMRDKFGLEFRIVDSTLMKELRRSRGLHVNPWAHFPRLVTSIDFLKRERPLRLLRDVLPGPDDPTYPRRFDLLILDEAHNAAPSGKGRYATDSLRTQAVRELAPHFEHKLFLTATPHNGYRESFCALLELLDNQRFSRGTEPDRRQLEAVMVRRLRTDPSFRRKWDGTLRFPPRVLEPLEVAYTEEERSIHADLRRYTKLRGERAQGHAERFATDFVLKTLKKRLFSCPAAFAATLAQHEKSLLTARKAGYGPRPTLSVLQKELDFMDEDYVSDGEYDEATAVAVDTASRLFNDPTQEETALLKRMKDWAARASAQLDSKAQGLIAWLDEHIRPGKVWGTGRVIIFTEYRATQNWLREVLASAGYTGGDRLLRMYGGMDPLDREAVKAAFQAAPEISPVRILLATDAASEGLDLQNYCSRLIHYEIPWNPNRMEQRNGRVDRHGQKADEVKVYHFVGKGYRDREARSFSGPVSDLEGDLEFLMRVARKIETIREDLGKVGPVLALQVEEAMLGRLSTLNTEGAEKEAEPIRKMLKFERDLAKQIQGLMQQYRETEREMRISPANVRRVVEVALDLADQPGLIPVTLTEGREAFRLPALKGSWASCAEGLADPYDRDKIRPTVFDSNSAKDHDDVVLAHLNHRLVQMALRLLRAEVWSQERNKGLTRITARIVPGHLLETPAVVAHARLVVIGGDTHRLHEEIISAGGLIKEGRFARMKVGEVEDALGAAIDREPGEKVKATLLGLYGKLAPALAQSLQVRTEEKTATLMKKLGERAAKEASDIRSILTELRRAIESELNDPEYAQPLLFEMEERVQFERNKASLEARVLEIPGKIEREAAAIRARYEDLQARMFPVAVTFLVPENIA